MTSTWLVIVIMCHIPPLRTKPSTHSAAAEPSQSTAGNGVMLWTTHTMTHTRFSNLLYWFYFISRAWWAGQVNFKSELLAKIKQMGSTCRNASTKCIIYDVANILGSGWGIQGGSRTHPVTNSMLKNGESIFINEHANPNILHINFQKPLDPASATDY